MLLMRRGWTITVGMMMAAAIAIPAMAQEPAKIATDSSPGDLVVDQGACAGHRWGVKERWKNRAKLRHQDRWLGHPEEFTESPLGASLNQNLHAQIANGDAARMVLYQMDFNAGQNQLSEKGRERLKRIAELLPVSFSPIVIEATNAPQLDEARRWEVLAELDRREFKVPQERVVLGSPVARGFNGREAESVERNLFKQTESRGAAAATGGGSGLTTGTAGGVTR